ALEVLVPARFLGLRLCLNDTIAPEGTNARNSTCWFTSGAADECRRGGQFSLSILSATAVGGRLTSCPGRHRDAIALHGHRRSLPAGHPAGDPGQCTAHRPRRVEAGGPAGGAGGD